MTEDKNVLRKLTQSAERMRKIQEAARKAAEETKEELPVTVK